MKKKICIAMFLFGLFMIFGIVGGVENGEPIKNMLWCIPCLIVMYVSIKMANKKRLRRKIK